MREGFEEKCTTGPGTKIWLEEVVSLEGNPSYDEGKKAYLDGGVRVSVPIDGTFERAFLWLCGWHDARQESSAVLAEQKVNIIRQLCDAPKGSFRIINPEK